MLGNTPFAPGQFSHGATRTPQRGAESARFVTCMPAGARRPREPRSHSGWLQSRQPTSASTSPRVRRRPQLRGRRTHSPRGTVTVCHVPEQRRTIAGVSNGEINRELTALTRVVRPRPRTGRRACQPIGTISGTVIATRETNALAVAQKLERFGGGRGIRTPDTLSGTTVFKTSTPVRFRASTSSGRAEPVEARAAPPRTV
jgi:hypothetical protein